LVASANASAAGGPQALGQFEFDAGNFSGTTFDFDVVLSVSNGSVTGSVQLYNITDSELVTTSLLTTTGLTPSLLTNTLVVGSGAGQFQDTAKLYEVRLAVTGSLPTDIVTLGSAILRLS